jgi:hypothetical protein
MEDVEPLGELAIDNSPHLPAPGAPRVDVHAYRPDVCDRVWYVSEMMEAQRALYQVCGKQAAHMISIEIGGLNELQGMTLGCTMDVPLEASSSRARLLASVGHC